MVTPEAATNRGSGSSPSTRSLLPPLAARTVSGRHDDIDDDDGLMDEMDSDHDVDDDEVDRPNERRRQRKAPGGDGEGAHQEPVRTECEDKPE